VNVEILGRVLRTIEQAAIGIETSVIAVHSISAAETLVTEDTQVAFDLRVPFLIVEDSEDCAKYSSLED
jgi:hypothetical protein